ncbi:MAG: serine/threonine protein kinase [Kofleriaceae bacterium]|jgi:serine/threonine protein kinase|nr:serine/threonine protein kinase [Kofleriaceae bacterium]MBP9172845.1 serine/threonine protein kinase [Kofleriaceae bacterium]MBP9863208.1 serine/threonine protein kinase [Kofleriaceae bacterium]
MGDDEPTIHGPTLAGGADTAAGRRDDAEPTRPVDVEGATGATSAFGLQGFAQRYLPGDSLGRGGMGEVRAWIDRAAGREVAVKTVRTDKRHAAALQRFAREARVQAQLEHPSIVPVYDLGTDADGAPYFTMKRVRGHSLARVLQALRADGADPTYSLRKLLTVMARVAMTLEYAHRRGVVNRDLKPSNIMLGAFDEVYVLDWGLAAIHDPEGAAPARAELLPGVVYSSAALYTPLIDSSSQPETAGNQLVGTPGYAAPEQAGDGSRGDRRSDVYALGVILFEILAGERAHRGDNVAAVMLSTFETDGLRPAGRRPDRAIPPELDDLVYAATRRDPADRLARAAEVAAALERYLDGDRELERRRAVAADQATEALAALARGRTEPSREADHRVLALQLIGRALAFDPECAPARAALVRAVAEPLSSPPPAAVAAFAAARVASFRRAAGLGALTLLSYLLYVPLVAWMGLRTPWMFAVMATAITTVFGLTTWYWRRPPADAALPWPHVAASTVALATGSWMFGSLLLLPAIALMTGVAYIGSAGRGALRFIAPAVAVVLGPLALELTGVIAPAYRIVDGAIQIMPRMTHFPPTATWAFLIVTHTVVIIVGLLYAHRLHRAYLDGERRLQAQAWQLAQLIPPDAQALVQPADEP